jgi:type IV pilus assembly protein PilY1
MTEEHVMKRTFALAFLAASLLASGAAMAAFDPVNDDTDIFLANPAFTATRPNVLLFLDNTANWAQSTGGVAPLDTKYGGVRTALTSVISGLSDAYNVGLATFVETGSPNSSIDGAYLRYGIRQMTATNKPFLTSVINSLDINGDKGNSAVYSLAMNEMFNYFAGRNSYSGHGKDKADAGDSVWFAAGREPHPGSPAGAPFSAAGLPAPTGSGTVQTYVSPITDACQKNFIIVISNGEANDNTSSLSTAQGFLAGITGTNPPATISISPSGSQGNWADEYAKFMANGDCNLAVPGIQNIYTYTIDILPKTTGQGPDHTALLKSMATNGKGKYFAINSLTSTTELEDALKAIFNEVQAVNSVFASTTLPVSVNVRGTNLNQVYIGVFRPDSNKSPRWLGNLKMYKLGVDTATESLFLADANGNAAENASTGFISGNATSFWTTGSTYWGFRDAALNGVGGASDAPDGDLVEKGGVAQRQRIRFATSHTPERSHYTCTGAEAGGLCAAGASLSATPFDSTNITSSDVGAFITKTITSLTSAGTTATAVIVGHGYSTGDIVRISGATPTNYNGDFSITKIDADTFTYEMLTAPDATRARATTSPGHELLDGDLTCISANPGGYSNCWNPITRISATQFDYTPGFPETTIGTAFPPSFGGRATSMVVGILGQTTVKAVVPNHGLAAGTIYNDNEAYLLSGPTYSNWSTDPDWYWWYQGCGSRTSSPAQVLDANTIQFPSYDYSCSLVASPVFGTPNGAHVTAPNHQFSTGQTITVSGATIGGYNVTTSIIKIDNNSFTFSSSAGLVDVTPGMSAGYQITSIVHPDKGSATVQDTATVTTVAPHGLTALTSSITLFNTGCLGYNGTHVVQSTPTPTTFTIFNAAISGCPVSVTSATQPNMIAGFAVTRIDPARIDTDNIIFWRTINVTALQPLTTATGVMLAGRPFTAADLSATLRDDIINWTRSSDNKDNEDTNSIPTDVRASVHGDVLHSRPATINYSRFPSDPLVAANDNDIYVFYGSNDGMLHAIKGGVASDEGGVSPGDERWAFIPKEFAGKVKRLRDQVPTVSAGAPKDYFFDGSIGVYVKDHVPSGGRAGMIGDALADPDPSKVDRAYLFLSLRRGGNFIYALDVTVPGDPKLLWRKGNIDSSISLPADAGWGELGQTWSEPRVARINTPIGAHNPDNVVLIFGAGYDETPEDINPCLVRSFSATDVEKFEIGTSTVTFTAAGSCTISPSPSSTQLVARNKGRGILVVDAFTGNVLWQVGAAPDGGATHNLTHPDMTCAIPSDVTVLDRNRDGVADRVYVGDTCGNVWRAEISEADPRRWKVTKIAALSGGSVNTMRKFLFPPDLVLSKDNQTSPPSPVYFSVLLGSGDREHPFDTNVGNSFYMIKDRDANSLSFEGMENTTTLSLAGGTSATNLPITSTDVFDATNVSGVNEFGWKIDLAAGEKSVGSAVTISGTTFFNTNQPSSTAGGGACGSNLGIARQYLVSYTDAAATTDLNGLGTLSIANRSTIHAGGGYLPSPVPVVVEIDGKKYQAVISGTSVQTPPGLTLDARLRTYWYKEVDQ